MDDIGLARVGHVNIIAYSKRPFKDVNHMKEELIRRFNERVKPEDTTYFLGDFSFGKMEERNEIIKRLNGTIVFIKGNHDKTGTCPIFSAIIKYGDGHYACICHDPINHIQPYQYCFHGHVHNLFKNKLVDGVIYCNVGVDVRNYYPVSIDELHDEINNIKCNAKDIKQQIKDINLKIDDGIIEEKEDEECRG